MKKSNNLTQKVYWKLIRLMRDSEIVPGQRLVFADLAKKLKVSRTPVNNALAILAQEGYLDFVPNQGYSVHRITQQEKKDLYEILEAMEISFIGHAIRRTTNQMLKTITRTKNKLDQLISENFNRKLFLFDTELHKAFLDMAGNANLSLRYSETCQKLYICFRPEGLSASRIADLQKEHEDLLEAVTLKDVDGAKTILHSHREIIENLEISMIADDGFIKWGSHGIPAVESLIPPHNFYESLSTEKSA